MRVCRSPRTVQREVDRWRTESRRIGLVPTMGALHEGHLSLVRAARKTCDRVVATIFVNPAQFGPREDLDRYPRTPARDLRLLKNEGADLVFTPRPGDLYPEAFDTWVVPGQLADMLEGRSRPGHFRGVATVCLKLFTICKPHDAFFGQKDYQQALVIRHMITDFDLGFRMQLCRTVRDPDGLAMSSRNRYLNPTQRLVALSLVRTLREAARRLRGGNGSPATAERLGASRLRATKGLRLDYFVVRNALTLKKPTPRDRDLVLLVAARVGSVRLIDNLRVRLNRGT